MTTGSPEETVIPTDGSADPLRQITIMNSRVLDLIAGPTEQWPAAGDQLYADFDISETNAPSGTHLKIGNATLEVTEAPHLGCHKFRARYGRDALHWVNSEAGMSLKLQRHQHPSNPARHHPRQATKSPRL